MKPKSPVQEKTGTGMNITNNSNQGMPNSIEQYVGNSYLSDIERNPNEETNSEVA